MTSATLDDVDAHLRSIISSLYMLIAQAHEYQGSTTQAAITAEIKRLLTALRDLTTTAQHANLTSTHVPFDLIEKFIEQGRNPDIYTRDLVEDVMRLNQRLQGRSEGYAKFADLLALQIVGAVPELRRDVEGLVGSFES